METDYLITYLHIHQNKAKKIHMTWPKIQDIWNKLFILDSCTPIYIKENIQYNNLWIYFQLRNV